MLLPARLRVSSSALKRIWRIRRLRQDVPHVSLFSTAQRFDEAAKPGKPSPDEQEQAQTNHNLAQKMLDKIGLRETWDKYGMYGVGTLLTLDALTLGGVYVMLQNPVLQPFSDMSVIEFFAKYDVFDLVHYFGINKADLTPKTTSLVTTIAVYKLLGPIRVGLAVVLTPSVARFFNTNPKT
eukprot:CAMPEP_0167771168 /NCGR_PEP_ID=MMETSP0111_2-20121227/121_1 /TAXON_ID=91324 /ORGANISM="Lotharella globosa, Strain CCCM811" /LENGTH=180 /DNA_ID=CAMNT_0007660477 /DNA_START=75 /DNA_END=617 /DNA_ORIENTATION=+